MTIYQSTYPSKLSISHNLLHTYFEAQIDADQNQIALVFQEQQVSYREVENSSNQLAHYLRALGIGKNSRVGLLMERSINVYIAVLGILKAGAAYVPMEPEYPADRVQYILDDSGVELLITSTALLAKNEITSCPCLCLEKEIAILKKHSSDRLTDVEVTSNDLCYIIYTSGSTGKPKGVMIEHGVAANFVDAAQEVYKIRSTDRVYQGFSIAFDASIEEIWLTFAAGATLIVGTTEMIHAGSDLSSILTNLGVTVFSCVPTLLSMLQEDIPSVRLLILGGESCVPELVQRWYRPDRRMLNTYGPTESAVIATYDECHPDRAITIGKPLSNYQIYILDEDLKPLPVDTPGQIYIGGKCLARGYVNRPDLTNEKFIWHPETNERIYNSGDLGCWTSDGNIQFLGRSDDQVKLRGFRIELSEIESVLMEFPSVQIAVVNIYEKALGIKELVAYLVLQEESIDLELVRDYLRERLPSFMMPTFFHRLAENEIPQLASGKVNRRLLPDPVAMPESFVPRADFLEPTNPQQLKIVEVWERLLKTKASIDDNFFDLGGHSLLVSLMVSELRRDAQFKQLAVADVYHHPTVATLETHVSGQSVIQPTLISQPHPQVGAQYWITVICQVMGIYGVQVISTLSFLIPAYIFTVFTSPLAILGSLALVIPSILFFQISASIIAKWLLIGRYRAGSYPLWGRYHLRWWLARQFQKAIPTQLMIGTPFLAWYYRLMGARIGQNCYLGTDVISDFDLIQVGSDTSLGAESSLVSHSISNGYLHLGPINIGQRCFIGARSIVNLHAQMGDDSQLSELSLLPDGANLPASECWRGSPARKAPHDSGIDFPHAPRPIKPLTSIFRNCFQLLGIIVISLLPTISILPGILFSQYVCNLFGWQGLLLVPLIAPVVVVILVAEIILLKKLLLPKVKPGLYNIQGGFYLRKWFVDRLLAMSVFWLGSIYATLYSAPWLRLLGAKIGSNSEVSHAKNFSPDLLSIGPDCFVADHVCFGAPRIHQGWAELLTIKVDRRSFLGNSSVILPGADIGSNSLIGCISRSPDQQKIVDGTNWIGSPAFNLPKRQQDENFDDSLTFRPARKLVGQRLLIEFIRIVMPQAFSLTLICTLLFIESHRQSTFLEMLEWLPFWSIGSGILASLLVVAAKWLIVGRYKSRSLPLWHNYVWRSELITGMYENIALPWFINSLLGTPLIAWYWRLLGVKVGARAYIDSPYVSEFDLVHIGDRVAINDVAVLQTHLFEDRVMKMSHVYMARNSSVGSRSIVLYDTEMEQGSQLGNLSLLMKGETLPANSAWLGIPAQRS
jgi:non-ribosomal peptide synthetase-like protein